MSTRPQLVFIPGEGEGAWEGERQMWDLLPVFLANVWSVFSHICLYTFPYDCPPFSLPLSLSLSFRPSLSRSLSFISLSFIMFFLVFLSLNLPVCLYFYKFVSLHFISLFAFSICYFVCFFNCYSFYLSFRPAMWFIPAPLSMFPPSPLRFHHFLYEAIKNSLSCFSHQRVANKIYFTKK